MSNSLSDGILPVPLNSLTPQTVMPEGGVVVISQPHPTDPTQRVFGTLLASAVPGASGSAGGTTTVPVSALPVASNVSGSDLIVVNQNGVDKQSTVDEVNSYGGTVTTPGTATPPGTGITTPPGTTTPPSTITESLSNTIINSINGIIYDAGLNSFQLVIASNGSLGVAYRGTYQNSTHDVNMGLYYNHAFWQQATDGYWYRWNGSGYDNGTQQDPRGSGTSTTPATSNPPTTSTPPPTGNNTGTASFEPYTYPEGTSGPYGGIGDTGSGNGPQAYMYGRSLGDLFGTYTYPNPGGTDQGYTLDQTITTLTGHMGIRPKTMNAFNGAGYGDIRNTGYNTFAYGWHNDSAANICGPGGFMRPIIGTKLGGQTQGWDYVSTYDDIANGVYDDAYLGDVNKWIEFGYKYLVYRNAYEFDGTFMPDFMGHTPAETARFAAALRHVILLQKNRCAQAGVAYKACFNPTYINDTDTDVMGAWPGDDVIDIIDCDQYNPCWNRTLQNFGADGRGLGTFAGSQSEWVQNPNNRKKFWNYPGIKDNYGADNYDYYGGGWSALRTIEIAKAKGKSIAFSECGTGGGDNTDAYVQNDSTWVRWFWGICQSAISQGVKIEHINIWNIWASDGQWWYSNNDYDPQPDVRLAYRKYFGDGAYPGGPTPTPGNGGSATVPPPATVTTSTPPPTATPPTATPPAVSGTVYNSGGSATSGTNGYAYVTTNNGVTANIILPTDKGNSVTGPANYTGLNTDLTFALVNGTWQLTASSPGNVTSATIKANNVKMISNLNNTSYVGSPSPPSGQYFSPGLFVDKETLGLSITGTNGNTASLTLPTNNQDQHFYDSDTGLGTNLSFFYYSPNNQWGCVADDASQISSGTIKTYGIFMATNFYCTFSDD